MKFTVSSSALLSLLATTGKVISNKNTLPILDFFLMELSGDELKVTSSDLETTLVGSIRVDSVEREGTVAAPAKQMLDSLKEFPELPLTIDVNDKSWEITINWKSGSLSIPGASAVSYPSVPQLNAEKKELEVDVDRLVNGINKTIFATADDELRPVMNGIYINLSPEAMTFVGTDAHKLVKYEAEVAGEISASFILPKKPANLLKSVLLTEEGPIAVAFDSKNAQFRLKSHTLVCRLIEGNYPNYNAVIPAANPNKVLVDRQELVNGIRRVAVVDPYDLAACDKVLKEELAAKEPSVIISRRPCALLKYVKHKAPLQVDADKCKSCKMCMKVGCPAISFQDGKAVIDNTLCTGCGVCSQLCKFGALEGKA